MHESFFLIKRNCITFGHLTATITWKKILLEAIEATLEQFFKQHTIIKLNDPYASENT